MTRPSPARARLVGQLAVPLALAALLAPAAHAEADRETLEALGQNERAPHEVALPPETPWGGESRARALPADHPWATPFERSGHLDSPDYAATMAWLGRLAEAAPEIAMLRFGESAEGRALVALLASKEGASSLEALRRNGRPTLLVQAGIHAGEIDGKDAGMMLLRDMSVVGSRAALLEGANLVLVPILSPDGHERRSRFARMNQRGPRHQGWRTNARNLNLNRDYAKLDTREVRAIVELVNELDPALYVDVHVTDGVDYQYDVTYGWNGPHGYSPAIARTMDASLRPFVDAALSEAGHTPGPLIFGIERNDMSRGRFDWTAGVRYSQGWGDARHLPSILVENHSLKSFDRRVFGTHVLMEALMEWLAREGEALEAAAARERARRPARVPLAFGRSEEEPQKESFLAVGSRIVRSPIGGDERVLWTGEPLTLEIPVIRANLPQQLVERPAAYWIPSAWRELAERLEAQGVALEQVDSPRALELERLVLADAELAERPFEGRVRVAAEVRAEPASLVMPPGSWRVSTDQPLGTLAMLLLEPASADSFFQWGFLHEILQRTEYFEAYALDPIAERMLEEDPALAEEFARRLAEDEAFRNDPRARRMFFYRRTPYYDERHLVYPVMRESRRGQSGPRGETGAADESPLESSSGEAGTPDAKE